MRLENRGGDVLARGGVRANFQQGGNVSQKKWDEIFGDYIPESEKTSANVLSAEQKESSETI